MSSFDDHSATGRAPTDDEASLRETLAAGTVQQRREAALGLVALADDDPLTAQTRARLAGRVHRDDDPDVRQFAVEALGRACRAAEECGNGAAVPAIEAALAEDDAEWVRAEAVVALSRADPDADALHEALGDDSEWVRRNALIALARTGRVGTDELVDRLKHDGAPAVREYAADYLPTVADDEERAVRLLAAVLARDPGAFVRARAATSLGDLGSDRAAEALESHGVTDRSDDVQRAAKRALATARGEDPEDLDLGDPGAPGGGPGSRGPGDGGRGGGGGPGAPPRDGAPAPRDVGPDPSGVPNATRRR